jgi:hypothetical protein
MRVLLSEGATWRHYFIPRDNGATLIEMRPAMLGWNVARVSVQGAESWPDKSADAIVAWRLASHGANVRELPREEVREGTPLRAMLDRQIARGPGRIGIDGIWEAE